MGLGKKSLTLVTLLLIVLVAIFFRFAYLEFTPPGLYPDEATNGLDALKTLDSGDFKFFYPDNNGREGLFINLQAVSISFFGASPWALRAVSGVFGVLAVIGLFLFTRLLWSTRVALLATYLTAVGFWAVNFSRIGFRAVMLPAILIWSFYFLWLGLKNRKSWALLVGGLIFGVGMHSYISFRIAPLLLLLLFVELWFHRAYPRPQLWRWAGAFLLGAVITASPLLLYYAQNPTDFLGRAAQVSIFEESSPIASLGGAVGKTLAMFNFVGDGNWRHNFAGRPLLYWPVGIGFLIGVILLLRRLTRKKANEDHFLLAWFLVLLIPNFLAPEGAPHALRALGAQPAVYIIAAFGLVWFYDKIQDRLSRAMIATPDKAARVGRIKKEITVLAIVIALFVGVWEGRTYFVKWAFNPHTHGAFTERLVDAGQFLKITSVPNKYFIVNEGGVDVDGVRIPSVTVRFITWEMRDQIKYLNSEDLKSLPANLSKAVLVFALPDEKLMGELRSLYPKAVQIGSPFVYGLRIP